MPINKSARPTTMSPITRPDEKASFSAELREVFAAKVVRAEEFVAIVIPI